jgi:hypothetical protein
VPNDSPVGAKRGGPAGGGGGGGGTGSDSSSGGEGGGAPRGRGPAPLPPPRKPQVIFCSRTHSQLSQFVGELHRTRFAASLSLAAVASRRALCVNDQARRAGAAIATPAHGAAGAGRRARAFAWWRARRRTQHSPRRPSPRCAAGR